MNSVILASQSPRRKEILQQLGIEFNVLLAEIDETASSNEKPKDLVARLAREKACAVVEEYQLEDLNWVIAGDTIVAKNEKVYGKPSDKAEAKAMLMALSGTQHSVFSSVAVWHQGNCQVAVNETLVKFKEVSEAEVATYLQSDEAMDKAGAYAIQGYSARWIEQIEGSYFAVVGLPVFELNQILEEMDFFKNQQN